MRLGFLLVLIGAALLNLAWFSAAQPDQSQQKQDRTDKVEIALRPQLQPGTQTVKPVGQGVVINGPAEIRPYTLARFKIDGVAEKSAVLWRIYPPEKVDRATTSREILEFVGPPGEYVIEVLVITITPEGIPRVDEARHKLRIGDPLPPPPPPPPPVPPDPFARELQSLYLADPSPTKKADLGLLIELYRQASTLANDTSIPTLSKLAERVAAAGTTLLSREKLQTVRRRIAQFIAAEFGDQDRDLTAEIRSKASATYLKVSEFLRSIGGE